jgi:hypothetical protein
LGSAGRPRFTIIEGLSARLEWRRGVMMGRMRRNRLVVEGWLLAAGGALAVDFTAGIEVRRWDSWVSGRRWRDGMPGYRGRYWDSWVCGRRWRDGMPGYRVARRYWDSWVCGRRWRDGMPGHRVVRRYWDSWVCGRRWRDLMIQWRIGALLIHESGMLPMIIVCHSLPVCSR